MEKFLKRCNKDYVKNTIIKHEEIFRDQVHELHRLYRVQKLLMDELESRNATSRTTLNCGVNARDWISLSASESCHISYASDGYQSTDHMDPEYRYLLPSGNRSRELTTCSEDARRRVHRGFDLERPAEEFNFTSTEGWSFQDQTTLKYGKQKKEKSKLKLPQRSWPDDESDIQLTLSIACGTENKSSTDFTASKY